MTEFLRQLAFASEAMTLALTGLAFWLFAGVCLVMERVRNARRSVERLEKVGWVPWTPLFLASAVIGGGLLLMSLPIVLGRI